MGLVQRTLVLKGAYSGKTIKLAGHQFVKGRLVLSLPAKDLDGLTRYLGRSYQAYQEGSVELQEPKPSVQETPAPAKGEAAEGQRTMKQGVSK